MICVEGFKIGMGEVCYIGVIFFWKYFQIVVKLCLQGGICGGVVIVYYFIWYLEVENFFVLKNNKGVEEKCICYMDYGV